MLDGRIALITGATGQLGSTLARALAVAGADLVVTSRSEPRLRALADELAATSGRRVHHFACDLLDRNAVTLLGPAAWGAFGRIDVVVNNAVPAGSQELGGDLLTTPHLVWLELLQAIAFAPLQLCADVAPRMREVGGGSIVNIVSNAGIDPVPGLDAYGFAKGGLMLLTRYMAREWGPWNVRVNAVSPGMIAGPESVASGPEALRILERTFLGRRGHADEVAGAVTYLASDAASFVSGQTIAVNGGRA